MKKILSIIALFAVCTCITACSESAENDAGDTIQSSVVKKNSLEGLKLARSMDYTISYVKDFEDLEEWSDLIVIGEFIDNSSVCDKRYSYCDFAQKDLLIGITSSCPMRITKVLAGEAQVGDVINILQDEGPHNNRFISHSNLTPMQMGDEWLFCLERSKSGKFGDDSYWCVSDNKGRYPTANASSNETVCFSDYPELGVYEQGDFCGDFYNKLVEKYGLDKA